MELLSAMVWLLVALGTCTENTFSTKGPSTEVWCRKSHCIAFFPLIPDCFLDFSFEYTIINF